MDPDDTELTDENDLSIISVGAGVPDRCIRITSGAGQSLRIEFDEYIPKVERWVTVARYFPKYCPECGRLLNEYENLKKERRQ